MYVWVGWRKGGQEKRRKRWRGSKNPRAVEEMRSHSETDLPLGARRQVRKCRI